MDPVKWVILRPQTESLQLETQGLLLPSSANILCGKESCPTILFTFLSSLTHTFCLFRCIEPFPCCSISESDCLIFHLLSFLCYLDSVCQYWGPMEVTFSPWILSSGLNCARELRASNLRHKDCYSHHLQTWFEEGNVVRQLGIFF